MAKDLDMTVLFDIYEPLLTEKQRDTLDLYYNEDLSLREIADPEGTTRQAVMNRIIKSEKRLLELEEMLGVYKRSKTAGVLLDRLAELTDGSDEAASLIKQIKELL
ncbi:MAG: DNA-binding protein [Ruminiclostridium sp.]|nr:DNA-binding protein [Ruminiclostridium sp.]